MEKTLKIIPPEGYEIDKEKSTFENIVFKKADIIKWNEYKTAVEIETENEHFLLDSTQPSFYCTWEDANRFYGDRIWTLPNLKQLEIIYKHFEEINNIIKRHNGYKLYKNTYWTNNLYIPSDICVFDMHDEGSSISSKKFKCYVRAVFNLK